MADKYSQDDRDKMAKAGTAMSDGSYPIADAEDLSNAIHAVGRGGADHDKIRKHIIGRAKALGMSSQIPDNWNSDGSLKSANAAPSYDRRKRLEGMKGVREVRRVAAPVMEVREAGGVLTLSGLASRTAAPYDMGGQLRETITRGAFANTLNRNPDVQLLINHEGLPIARTTIPAGQPGSLTLRETEDGLVFDAQCDPADPDVARVAQKIRSGLMDQCSFAFRVVQQQWRWMEDTDLDYDERVISEVSLDRGDVSIVNYGANPATNIAIRAALADMSDEDLAEYRLARVERDMTNQGNPGCGCCPDCMGTAPAKMAQVSAPACHESRVADLDLYRARAYALSLKG